VLNVYSSFDCSVSPAGALLLYQQQQRSKQESAAPTSKLLFKKLNKSAFFSPDFCGRCGTHESKSRFAQTAAAENPTKITPSSAWLMGTTSKSKA